MFKIANHHPDFSVKVAPMIVDRPVAGTADWILSNAARPFAAPSASAQWLQDEAAAFLVHELEQ